MEERESRVLQKGEIRSLVSLLCTAKMEMSRDNGKTFFMRYVVDDDVLPENFTIYED